MTPALTSRGRKTTTWCLRVRSHWGRLWGGLVSAPRLSGPAPNFPVATSTGHQPPASDQRGLAALPGSGSQRLPACLLSAGGLCGLPSPQATLFWTSKGSAEARGAKEGQARSGVPTTLPLVGALCTELGFPFHGSKSTEHPGKSLGGAVGCRGAVHRMAGGPLPPTVSMTRTQWEPAALGA